MLICKHCESERKNLNSLRNHERTCPSNKDRIYVSHTQGKTAWNKGLSKETDSRVAQYSKTLAVVNKGRPNTTVWTYEMRKAKSEWRKQLHIDHPETHPNRKLAGNRKKMSYPEQVAFDYLTGTGVQFEHNKKIGKYFPDFVIGNLIIEIDGKQWHKDKEKDTQRDLILNSHGYTVIRISTDENIESKLEEIVNGDYVSLDRRSALGAEGREFKSHIPDISPEVINKAN
jgi:very-short-patch-repair endonuclease